MKGFRELTSVSDALDEIRKRVTWRIREVEEVDLLSALGRICGENISAPLDSPPYDRSAVDGYAVVAEDTFGASTTNPIELKLVGRVEAGMVAKQVPRISRELAVEIFTGAPLPPGANAVVPVENTKKKGDIVEIFLQVHPYQNVSRRGEDYRVGDVVLKRGSIIKSWHIGALASLGISKIKVLRRPRIALISTGSELAQPGERIEAGKIYDSTKPMLKAMLREYGSDPIDLGIAKDDLKEISNKLSRGLKEADAVIVTGGTSVGEKDLVPEAVSENAEIIVHGLKIRPAKPTGFAIANGKPIFMLSGFPVAALIGFQVLVVPALEQILECRFDPKPRTRGILTRRVASPPGIRTYVRVRVFKDELGRVLVEPLRVTGSGVLSTLTRGNGLLVIPEEVEGFDEGEVVDVELFSPVEFNSSSD